MYSEDINIFQIDYSIANSVGLEILKEHNIFPLQRKELYTLVASSQQNNNELYLISVFNSPIKFITVAQKSIDFKLNNFHFHHQIYNLVQNTLSNIKQQNMQSGYITQLVDNIISYAIELNSSDIHIEVTKIEMMIRFRIDGVLYLIFTFEKQLHPLLLSVIKLCANLDISLDRLPQDGRFTKVYENIEFDFRMSTIPTIHGESLAIRILNSNNSRIVLDEIGFDKRHLVSLKKAIFSTHGLILVTGPTGSGKTTTLYSILNELNTTSKKIITVEDPIEYNIEGIQQININDDIGLTYPVALKSILRQDPDIIMIGEIRDEKALKIALQAALTGHLVLATLHTSNAVQTINRLLDLNAEPFLIAATLRAIISQRLVRKISLDKMKKFEGRVIIAEFLNCDEKVSTMIAQNDSISNIVKYLKSKGFETLEEDGLKKVASGMISEEELYLQI